MSIDGIRKKQIHKTIIQRKAVVKERFHPFTPKFIIPEYIEAAEHSVSSKKLHHYFAFKKLKTPAIIFSTFAFTFLLTVATSQGLAELNGELHPNINKIADSLPDGAKLPDPGQFPQVLSITTKPQTALLNDVVLNSPDELYLPIEKITVPDPIKKRKEFLEDYLKARNSPLADHVDAISEQSQWKLIIAISRAESSFCKRQERNNCWGIGGAWNLKNYDNFDDAVADVNRILEQHYIAAGLDSPSKIVNKWVGHPNDNWEAAVEQELNNLEDVE